MRGSDITLTVAGIVVMGIIINSMVPLDQLLQFDAVFSGFTGVFGVFGIVASSPVVVILGILAIAVFVVRRIA